MINIGVNNIDNLYLGSLEIDKLYLGANIVYSRSSENELLQTVQINLTNDNTPIPNWNNFLNANISLINTDNISSQWTFENISGNINHEGPYGNTVDIDRFPAAVLSTLSYTANSTKEVAITGLNNNNNYKLILGSYLGIDATAEDWTRFIVNGEIKVTEIQNNATLYTTIFENITPINGRIDISFTGAETTYYGCLNGIIIEEYSGGGIPPEPDPNNNEEELTATNIYKADTVLKYGTTDLAIDGDSVGVIKDQKGGRDLIYRGSATPAVMGVPPKLTIDGVLKPSIRFYNVPELDYQSNDYLPVAYPYALGFVFQSLPSQTYEAWINDYGSGTYIGNAGTVLRISAQNGEVQGETLPLDMEYTYLHVEYKIDTVDVYINGTFRGSIANPLVDGNGVQFKVRNALAVYTNNADFNWMAKYLWLGEDYSYMVANRQIVMDSIINKYLVGSMETNPYASNVLPSYNVGTQTFTVTHTANNSTNPSATEYQWWLRVRTETSAGNFAPQVLVGTSKDLPRSAIQSYIDNDTAVWLTPYVKQDGVFQFIRGGGSTGFIEI